MQNSPWQRKIRTVVAWRGGELTTKLNDGTFLNDRMFCAWRGVWVAKVLHLLDFIDGILKFVHFIACKFWSRKKKQSPQRVSPLMIPTLKYFRVSVQMPATHCEMHQKSKMDWCAETDGKINSEVSTEERERWGLVGRCVTGCAHHKIPSTFPYLWNFA